MAKNVSKLRFISLAIFCILLFAPLMTVIADDDSFTETVGQGQIDWENGVIRVSGFGAIPQQGSQAQAKLMGKQAAKTDAFRNAIEILEGVRVNSETLVKNFETESDEIRTSAQGYIKSARIIDTIYNSDGTCEVVIEVPLGGKVQFSQLLINKLIEKLAGQPTLPSSTKSNVLTDYTGIVIDARNLGVKPALYPQVFDSNGNLLYGPTIPNINFDKVKTIVAYAKTPERALKLDRIGKKPLQLTATSIVRAAKGESTDVVLNANDAKAFCEAAYQNNLLIKAAVVFIID